MYKMSVCVVYVVCVCVCEKTCIDGNMYMKVSFMCIRVASMVYENQLPMNT